MERALLIIMTNLRSDWKSLGMHLQSHMITNLTLLMKQEVKKSEWNWATQPNIRTRRISFPIATRLSNQWNILMKVTYKFMLVCLIVFSIFLILPKQMYAIPLLRECLFNPLHFKMTESWYWKWVFTINWEQQQQSTYGSSSAVKSYAFFSAWNFWQLLCCLIRYVSYSLWNCAAWSIFSVSDPWLLM